MKIFTAQQLHQADQQTLKAQDISALDLMERAATDAYQQLEKRSREKSVIKLFCGIGNNGGDGLVIARKLAEKRRNIEVFIVEYSPKHSPEFTANLKRLKKRVPADKIKWLHKERHLPEIDPEEVVVDAVFGIGLNRPLPDWVSELVRHLNNKSCYRIAIDLPTGLFSNRVPKRGEQVLQADLTLTFQSPKLVFYLPETSAYTGQVMVLDIGLDKAYLDRLTPVAKLIQKADVELIKKPRKRFSHKGTYGHCLVIGGSYGKMGSVVLATRAALRSGAGKVTSMTPKCGDNILQISVPEAMVLTDKSDQILRHFTPPSFSVESICFGPGVGTDPQTAHFFKALLQFCTKPMLIDADGLNLLAQHPHLFDLIPKNTVLTPHPGELKRLIGAWTDSFDKIDKLKAFSQKYQVVVVAKDAVTLTVFGDQIYVNSTGNPGMATAGSGDVLSGVIAGLMAQGYSSINAAVLGVYLHGKAGDVAVKNRAFESLLAGDIVDELGAVF